MATVVEVMLRMVRSTALKVAKFRLTDGQDGSKLVVDKMVRQNDTRKAVVHARAAMVVSSAQLSVVALTAA